MILFPEMGIMRSTLTEPGIFFTKNDIIFVGCEKAFYSLQQKAFVSAPSPPLHNFADSKAAPATALHFTCSHLFVGHTPEKRVEKRRLLLHLLGPLEESTAKVSGKMRARLKRVARPLYSMRSQALPRVRAKFWLDCR